MTDPVVGTQSRRPPARPPSGGLAFLVLLAAAAIGSLLIYRGLSTVTEAAPVATSLILDETVSATGTPGPGIPRSESRVVTLEATTDGLEIVNWSPQALPRTTQTTPDVALFLDYDLSLSWAATIRSTLRGRFLHLLLPGVFEPRWFVPSSEGISSFAWHATEPARLAWVAGTPGEEPALLIGNAGDLVYRQVGPDHLTMLPRGSVLRAWGDWGFVISRDGGGLQVLDPAGRTVGERRGISLVGAGTDGRLLVIADTGGSEWLWTDRTLSETRPAGPSGSRLVWSSDRERLAVVDQGRERVRIRIVDTADGNPLRQVTVRMDSSLGEMLRWTQDDFLVGHLADGLTLVVIDLRGQRAETLERPGRDGSLWGLWVEQASLLP